MNWIDDFLSNARILVECSCRSNVVDFDSLFYLARFPGILST